MSPTDMQEKLHFCEVKRIVDKCTIDKDKDEITPYAVVPKYNRTRMMFKGAQLGLCQYETPCRELDGVWYAPLGVLIGYIGGSVIKEKGKITLEVYGRRAEFFEDSDVAVTDRGEVKLECAVKRLDRDQLYMPASACEVFDMRWAYAKRNNFISFEHESEDKPITEQP